MENDFAEQQVFLLIAVGVLAMLLLALAFVAFFYYTRQRLLAEKNRMQTMELEYQEAVLQGAINVQEEERHRIARELHDEIGSKLNAILMQLQLVKKETEQSTGLVSTMSDIQSLIHSTIKTTRRISHDLLPPTLEAFGLVEALRELADSFNQTKALWVHLQVIPGASIPDDRQKQLHLFRVIQELITNSVKHGRATEIKVVISPATQGTQVLYQDNGKGFEPEQVKQAKGLGMKNIETRLRIIEAQLELDSSPGKGMEAKIYLN